jgi:hypothetical protein
VALVLVAAGTYFLSALLVWMVRKSERLEFFKRFWHFMKSGGKERKPNVEQGKSN